MKAFLKTVAQDMLAKYGTNMSDIAVVFPNKRAALFLNTYLAQLAGKPIWTPTYITISDLFRRHSDLKVADPIKSICDLHKVFVACTGIDETLDHFYGWGQLLLADFDDVDKNMVDAKLLFANLSDIHELDDVSYLTDYQKAMIKKFFSNFSDDHNTELKKRFLQLWSHFYDIYVGFNQKLAEQQLAYEGALYRKVVNDEDIDFHYKKYLFIGFNMMQIVEQTLCDRLLKQGKALFYWDYDKYYMEGQNEAGHYIRQYLKHYPNELASYPQKDIYDNMSKNKDITYISAPTENIQARYVNAWLKEHNRYKMGRNVAIVLSDENLLQSVIHSLPEEVKSVNITIGYPCSKHLSTVSSSSSSSCKEQVIHSIARPTVFIMCSQHCAIPIRDSSAHGMPTCLKSWKSRNASTHRAISSAWMETKDSLCFSETWKSRRQKPRKAATTSSSSATCLIFCA